MWDLRPVDTSRIQSLTEHFFEKASQRATLIEPPEDPNVVVRAVRFLGSTYAIPPMKEDTDWFDQSLEMGLHLALPASALDVDALEFLGDLERGIQRWRELAAESNH
jgi:hypothetical protein